MSEIVEAEEFESALLEAPEMIVLDKRMAALEMAMSLVCNREEGSSGADAVEVTRIADVFLEWLREDDE